MTYAQIIVFVLIIIMGIVWILSVLSKPVTVASREYIEKTIMAVLATATKFGGSVHVYYCKGGMTISYLPEEDEEDDESVQDGD